MIISDQISYGHLFVVTCYSTNKAWLRSPDYLFYPGIYRVTTGSDPRSRLCLLNQLLSVRKLGLSPRDLCIPHTILDFIDAQKSPNEQTQNLEFPPIFLIISSVQFSSVAQLCLTFCGPMNCSTPDLPVHHQLSEFTQTHVHRVGGAIQPSLPLSSPSPPAPNPSQHQSLFQ